MALRVPFRTLDFIREYEKHVCLWNTVHPLYRQKDQRDASLDAIALAMGPDSAMSRRDVSTKIRYLRARFYNEVTRVSSDPANISRPDWFIAMERFMPFINHNFQVLPRPSSSNGPQFRFNQTPNHASNVSTAFFSHPLPPPKRMRFAQQMHVIQTLEQSMHHAVKSLKDIAEQENEPHQIPQNEFEAFGQNVSLQLQMLPMSDALKCQEQILNILKLHRIHPNLDQNSVSTNAPTPSPSSADGYNEFNRATPDDHQQIVCKLVSDLQDDTNDSYLSKFSDSDILEKKKNRYIMDEYEINECSPEQDTSVNNTLNPVEETYLGDSLPEFANSSDNSFELVIECKEENNVVDICSDSE